MRSHRRSPPPLLLCAFGSTYLLFSHFWLRRLRVTQCFVFRSFPFSSCAWSLESERKLFENSPANSFWFFRLYSDEWTTINEKFESNEIFLFTDKKIYNKIGVACFQCLWNMKMRCQQPDNDINEYYASWYEKYPVINKISDICLHVRIECICSEMSSMMFDVMIFHVNGRMHINNWCIVIEHQQQQQQNK